MFLQHCLSLKSRVQACEICPDLMSPWDHWPLCLLPDQHHAALKVSDTCAPGRLYHDTMIHLFSWPLTFVLSISLVYRGQIKFSENFGCGLETVEVFILLDHLMNTVECVPAHTQETRLPPQRKGGVMLWVNLISSWAMKGRASDPGLLLLSWGVSAFS